MDVRLEDKKAAISIIGLGYVGLPIALSFAKKRKVIAFDINPKRIEMLKKGIDPSGELEEKDFLQTDILFTTEAKDLAQAWCHIVAVPTPIDKHTMPDLEPLLKASKTVGSILKKGDYVIFESTVYPGCTEEDCLPILEEMSGLKFGKDFKLGYSPERINPGDKEHNLNNVVKVVSGSDEEALATVSDLYKQIVGAGVYEASSIKVAEAAKIIENTQRDLNIALMNELSMICERLQINTFEVLEAAGTKWNFLRFSPGLVGGHCIGVDPYYLTYKSKALGHDPTVILSGRYINDQMGGYIAKKVVQKMVKLGKNLTESKVLVLGATFKENVGDIRNSKVADVVNELKAFSLGVDVIDPFANAEELLEEYGFSICNETQSDYDAIILAVPHRPFLQMKEKDFLKMVRSPAVFVDVKGIFRNQIQEMEYWSL